MSPPFAKVTETNGVVRWVNLTHVRELVVRSSKPGEHTLTEIHIDNNFVAKIVRVVETPEAILLQTGG